MAKFFPWKSHPAGQERIRWRSLLALLLGTALLAAGCGNQITTVPTTTDSEAATPAVAEGALLAGDLPTEIGTELVYSANAPGSTVRVSFDLNGPWNFAAGPTNSTLTITSIAKETAPSQDLFPEASEALRSTWSDAGQPITYDFQAKSDSSWRSFGQASATASVINESPALMLIFPADLGSQWTDTFVRTSGDQAIEVTRDNLIVSRNRITVPAGTYFDALLLQTRITSIGADATTISWDYAWYVPGVGRVAEIISEPDEPGETFNSAAAFYRLRRIR